MYLENGERWEQLILWSFPAYTDKDLELKVNKLNSTSFSGDSLPVCSQILCQHICLDK